MKTIYLDYDVAVVGSGPGGLAAAITAARQGAKTLLVERLGFLGGNAASGSPLLGFWDKKGRRTVAGLGDEIVRRFAAEGISEGYRLCPQHQSVVTMAPEYAKLIYAKMCAEAGVDVVLHAEARGAEADNGQITKILLSGRGQTVEVTAKIFIDSADGDIGYLAGAEYEKGHADGSLQPPSILYSIGNIDEDRFLDYLRDNPEEAGCFTQEYLRSSRNYVFVGLHPLWKRLNPLGQWPMAIWAAIMINTPNKGQMVINGPRMGGTDASDILSITKAELKGQQQAADFLEVLRTHVAGFEEAYITGINATIAIRETRRIVGHKMLRVDSVQRGEVPPDTIALSSYPIDIHGNDHTSKMIAVAEPFGIPYLCLVSRSFRNLMMTGRSISVDPDVYGSTRVMAQCFAVGEAAGIGAAMAIREGRDPAALDAQAIRKVLQAGGALLEVNDADVLHEPSLGR